MKILDIAIKDFTRSFRSYFALAFMFGVPLLMTSLFYLMFGSISAKDESVGISTTKVVIANLDQGEGSFQQGVEIVQPGMAVHSVGELVVKVLKDEQLAALLEVSIASDADSARSAVDLQQAGMAIIIPETFSADFSSAGTAAELEIYQDPTLTIGPAIVRSILSQAIDGFSGVKITANVALAQGLATDSDETRQVLQQYLAASLPFQQNPNAMLEVQSPKKAPAAGSPIGAMVGGIMGGMLIFFAFFTGASTAQSILREEEEGTLPRLFTTPTSQATILSGKFLAVGLTVITQVSVLLILARLIFGIAWGTAQSIILAAIGIMAVATAFGIFLMSLLKNARQAGSMIGGVLTVTGMLGMMPVFLQSSNNTPPFLNTISLTVPQGWANRILFQSMEGATLMQVLPTFAVLITLSLVLFVLGVLRFQRRYV
jgi:ABC-2 type transport system permease protein